MIQAYRIVKKKWANSAFDGEGARLYGGRWNSAGKSCVYVASTESLAILEVLVHLNDSTMFDDFTIFILSLEASDIMTLEHENLPDNWRENPAPSETAELGDEWLTSNLSAALATPSTIVPRELNYLLNTSHPRYKEIIATASELDLKLDSRLTNVTNN